MKKRYYACMCMAIAFTFGLSHITAQAAERRQIPDTAPVAPNQNADKPIEITADEALEWHRNDKKYIAKKNVLVQQGDVTISSDEIVADYREGGNAGTEIYRLTATGSVKITSRGNTAKSDKAVYDVDAGTAVMTGDKLMLVSPDQTVTAKDSFTYYVPDGKVVADNNVVVTRGKDRLYTDLLTAYFEENKAGKRELKRLVADRNVVIKTPTETVRGAKGIYDAATNIAQITGNVRIEREQNVLEGEKAQVNLTTNVSAIIGDQSAGERVRGVFYPSEDTKDVLK